MNRFIIVVPVYNCVQWIGRCLDSITGQDYEDYDVVVVDDHSEDGTWEIIEHYDVCAIRNMNRIGSGLVNIFKGIDFMSKDDNDVIVTVDGDDYLIDNQVLRTLDEVYTGDVWMAYSKFRPVSGSYPDYGAAIVDTKIYRYSKTWVSSHLRTFRRWLWYKIADNDLRDRDGEYFKVAWDFAFMFPMIEMAGVHLRFIDKVLYMYNDMNPNNDGKTNPAHQIATAEYILNKNQYKEL